MKLLYIKLFIKKIYITNSFRELNSLWKVPLYYGFCICKRKKQEVLLYRCFLFCITITTFFCHCVLERKNRKEAHHGKKNPELLITSCERCHSLSCQHYRLNCFGAETTTWDWLYSVIKHRVSPTSWLVITVSQKQNWTIIGAKCCINI